jgi:transposase
MRLPHVLGSPRHEGILESVCSELTPFEHTTTLVAVIELSQSSWLIAGTIPGIERQPLKKIAPDETELLRVLHRWRDEGVRKGLTTTRIGVAFEAG